MCFLTRLTGHACVPVLPTIDSGGIAGDFSGCGLVQDTTHQFGGEAEYSLIFVYVCAYTTPAQTSRFRQTEETGCVMSPWQFGASFESEMLAL